MFFLHEHARKIGIWYAFFISAPFWSPFFGNFMVAGLGTWQPIFWMVFAIGALLLCLVILFGDETFYNRSISNERQPSRPMSTVSRLTRVAGIWQIRHHQGYFAGLLRSYGRLFDVFTKPVVILSMIS